MTITFSELCDILAEAKGVPREIFTMVPLYIKLTQQDGAKVFKRNKIYEITKPTYGAPSVILDLDNNGDLISIEFA